MPDIRRTFVVEFAFDADAFAFFLQSEAEIRRVQRIGLRLSQLRHAAVVQADRRIVGRQ